MITDQNLNKPIIGIYYLEEDGARLGLTKKPNWFRRICAYLFLGWVWEDVIKNK